jgi:hypothetical protein
MQAWLGSPYRAVGFYLGGRSEGCGNVPRWSPSTINSVRNMGWKIIPIYVDLQAPCAGYNASIPYDPTAASNEGITSANNAVARMQFLGMGASNVPIYLDVEHYPRDGGACTEAVRRYTSGWSGRLHQLGYLSGLYSSASSGVQDAWGVYGNPAYNQLDVIWFADWRCPLPGNPSLLDENKTWLPDNVWTNHQRIRQYIGGTNYCVDPPATYYESYGGVEMNIDVDNLDAPVVG